MRTFRLPGCDKGMKPSLLLTCFLTIALLALSVMPAAADTPASGPTYVVQQGDTLWSIAQRFNVSVADLASANNLADTTIFAGEILVIPGLQGLTGTLTAQPVQFGQTLRSLARQYGLDVSTLTRLNHLISPAQLYVGYSLTLLQQAKPPAPQAQAGLVKGQSLLELAVEQNTDPWTLAGINQLDGTWEALPGDALDLPSAGADGSTPSGLPGVFASAGVDPLPVLQGSTVQVKALTRQPVTLAGSLAGHDLHFYSSADDTYVALQGIEADKTPGLYPLDLTATLADGSTESFEQMVLVDSGNYLHDTTIYTVDPKTIDPEYTDPDATKVKALVSNSTSDKYWQGQFSSPASLYLQNTYISSPFGIRRSYIGIGTSLTLETFHSGMDYAGNNGQQITAPAAGVVVFTGPLVVCGNATYIYHGWGIYSGICHQSEIDVTVGETVQQGQVIGLVGRTGRALGPNLHWEVWVNGVTVNPQEWLGQIFPH